jgi:hypothetical protein
MNGWIITAALFIGILTGILLMLSWITRARRKGYAKWIHDWEQVDWSHAAYRDGVKDPKLAGEEYMVKIHFGWNGIAAKYVLDCVVWELRKRLGQDGVVRVEVLRRKGL